MKFALALTMLSSSLLLQAAPQKADETAQSAEFKALQKKRVERRLKDIYREKVESRKSNVLKNKATKHTNILAEKYEKLITDNDESEESEIHAAMNPTDSNNIVISAIKPSEFGFILPVFYTKDFGKTWKKSQFAPGGQGGGDPVFTYDAEGNLYFSWIAVEQTEVALDNAILYSASKDGGATWAEPDTIYSGSLDFFTGEGTFGDKQWMAVDKSTSPKRNTVYTVLIEFEGESAAIVVRKKPASTTKFLKKSVNVSGFDFLEMQFSGIEVDATGKIHVFFWGLKEDGPRSYLWHAYSTDGAENFSEPQIIASVRFPEMQDELPTYLPGRFGALPQFAVDHNPASPNNGNMYAIWCSNDLKKLNDPTYDEPFHIYFSRSTDGGNSWSAPLRLNDDNTSFRADHFHPSLDVTPKGDVVVTWYDGRQSGNGSNVHYYTSFSFDGGGTFLKNIKVSDKSSDLNQQGYFGIGDYTKTLSSNGYAIPIWADGRTNDGNIKIYAAFVPLTAANSTGIERVSDIVSGLSIENVYPNPAQNKATVRFSTSTSSLIEMDILDIMGKPLQNIFKKQFEIGEFAVDIPLQELSTGKYFIRIKSGGAILTQPLTVTR